MFLLLTAPICGGIVPHVIQDKGSLICRCCFEWAEKVRLRVYFDKYFWTSENNRNFPRRVTRRELSMLKEMHPRDFSDEYGVVGVYASLKPFPKPPRFLSASRNHSFYRQKKPFQVAYDGPSFCTKRFSDKKSFGKIVTRLLSYALTVSPVPHIWSGDCHVRGRLVDSLRIIELVPGTGGTVIIFF